MKIGIVAFCLLCCCFEVLHGIHHCSSITSCTASCEENGTTITPFIRDEFPRENFTFNCPLPSTVKGFHMKLFNRQINEEICTLYIDNGKKYSKGTDQFCEPIHSDDKVSFILRNLKSKHSGTYFCCLEGLTPTYRCCRANEKHLYIQDSEESCLLSERTSWILVALVVFSFIACIFSSISCCFRNVVGQRPSTQENTNEYMSMAALERSLK